MKNYLFTTLLIALAVSLTPSSTAQISLDWAGSIGGQTPDFGSVSATDPQGNIYITGYFRNTIDLDPGPGVANFMANGEEDLFIQKLSPSGNLLWAKTIGGNWYDRVGKLFIDSLNNITVIGQFLGAVDFDPGNGTHILNASTSGNRAFILKLDSAGNFLWANTIPGFSLTLSCDYAGNSYISGNFEFTQDFDPGPGIFNLTANGLYDFFIQKLDPQGNFLWAKSYQSGNSISAVGGNKSLTGQNNEIYLSGIFTGTVDFDPGPGTFNLTSANQNDIFITKLTSSGNLVWAKCLSSTFPNRVLNIAEDLHSNVILTGFFGDSLDFDPGPGMSLSTSNGFYDVFVLKLDPNGDYLWAKTLGSSQSDIGNSIKTDHAGSIYVAGTFRDTADFNPGSGSHILPAEGKGIFITKLDPQGDFLWAEGIYDTYWLDSPSMTIDPQGDLILTGRFFDSVDVDPGISNHWVLNQPTTSMHNVDVFIAKYKNTTNYTVISPQVCSSYTTPGGNATYVSSGTYIDTLTNSSGNDSLVVIHLLVQPPDPSFSQSGSTLVANQPGVLYQWLDCNNNHQPIPGATGSSFTPLTNGSYALAVTGFGCSDTSSCMPITGVGIEDFSQTEEVKIFPNPTQGRVTLKIKNPSANLRLEILNINGQLVMSQTPLSTDQVIDLPPANGLYFARIWSDQSSPQVFRILKQD